MTPLDQAHTAMTAAPDDDIPRLRYYDRLAETELFLLLECEAQGQSITPAVFDTSDGRFVLAFDLEERLTAFSNGPAPYAALSGRKVAAMLRDQEIGLGVNLGVAPSAFAIPAGALSWLDDTLGTDIEQTEARPEEIKPPAGLPEALITSLDTKLATATGLARMAYLVAVTYPGPRPGHMLAFIDAKPGAEPALTQAISEALIFSGIEAGTLDIAFLTASDTIASQLAKHGLRFDLPQPQSQKPPGSDPTKPPKLR